ncbi:STAS domain-containing protein [Pseudoprimorskyibacter insulae]|uniref:STAS domain-containing protein n=1 Tax=Pseudoprimorskyibacter insulae TaxID=1695997 RepID=A0A2R8B0W6_9RHOB|nr:STAS domain-containing protein [Pseudoprimorskyibacter insulae]SPF81938.1 hypothetical protein PRI8871_03765 [Pseudoprimorskyibacter insulae]
MPDDVRQFQLPKRRGRSDDDPLLTFLKASLGRPVLLDLSDVDRIDSLRLRTLLSANRKWRQDGARLAITGLTDACADMFRLLGVDPIIFEQERV